MTSTIDRDTEEATDLVQMKATDVQVIVDAMELIYIEELENAMSQPHTVSVEEAVQHFKIHVGEINQSSLHAALDAARKKLDEARQDQSEIETTESKQSTLTLLATTLSSSAALGMAASALAPMAVTIPIVAAAIGGAIGWIFAEKSARVREKRS